MVQSTLHLDKFFIGGYFNGHIGSNVRGYDGFGFGVRNEEGTSLLDFASYFDLVVANSSFSKREKHLGTFRSMVSKT